MTTVRTIPVHEIVRRTYPRPPPSERDEIAMAIGRAIDGALTEAGHAARTGRRPTATAMRAIAATRLDDALAEGGVGLPPGERAVVDRQIEGVLQAFRKSEIFGLARPKTRVIVINEQVAVYAQPDYWDGRSRFFEMKSYRAVPPPPDVALQLRLFQLAFPRFEAVLLCINRHADPVETVSIRIPAPEAAEATAALRSALALGREFGEEKVREYLEGPFVHYAIPEPAVPPPSATGEVDPG
jgi:hypothetical protein